MPASRLHPFGRLVCCAIVLLIAVSAVQTVGLGVVLAFSARLGLSSLPIDQRLLKAALTYGLYLTVASYPAALGVLYLFRTRVDKYTWRSLGFTRERAGTNLARGALTALLTLSVLFALMWVAGAVRFGGLSADAKASGFAYSLMALLGYGLAFGAVGFFEETLFRGYGMANLRQWLGWPVALLGQAAVFAVVHLANGAGKPEAMQAAIAGLPNLFLIAVFFGMAYRKTGSLWFPIGFHIAWNWLLGCVFSLPVSGIPTFRLFEVQSTGMSFLSGGLFGAEGSFFLIPLVLAMIYAMWMVPDHPRAVANLDNPESNEMPQVSYVPVPMPVGASPVYTNGMTTETTEDEEPRNNRYRARFGSGEGFDSDMLRELKQMQEAREQAERERIEAQKAYQRAEEMRQAEIRRAQIAAQQHTISVAEITETVPVTSETATPVTVETPIQEQVPMAVQEVISLPTTPVPTEAEVAVIAATPLAPTAPVAPIEPVAPQGEPASPSVPVQPQPTRRTLDSRPRTSTLPPATPASQEAAPAKAVPLIAPSDDTTPTDPKDAPPKKARPRW